MYILASGIHKIQKLQNVTASHNFLSSWQSAQNTSTYESAVHLHVTPEDEKIVIFVWV